MILCKKVLEFRGIALQQIQLYFQELGGSRLSNHFPIHYQGENWCATILKEEELAFTSAFKVNSVPIEFKAETEEKLTEIIAQFRKKSFRAGG